MKRTDLMLGLYILVPIIFLIIPIPLFLLDILMMLNLAIALFILFNALFSTEALNMSSFPTLLLMTTLFRISLNVGSTRNILLKGEAGNVVQAFGEFVGGGNLIVGGIVFLILIIVQFIVINKGSERVSEVTARFTLDAMPGKQMAIDADLSSGLIDEESHAFTAYVEECDGQPAFRLGTPSKDSGRIYFFRSDGWCFEVCKG